jgi:hypothetical protein
MTILQAHNIAYGLNRQLRNQFAEQLAAIHPEAHICYHSQYEKFTVSIFSSSEAVTNLVYSTDFVDIYSHFEYSDAIEQLALNLTEYILEEQPCTAIKNYTEVMQTAIAE